MVSPLGILASLTVSFSSLSRVCDKWQIFSLEFSEYLWGGQRLTLGLAWTASLQTEDE